MNGTPGEERHIEQLLGHAPPRTRPPASVRRAVRERLESEWRARLRQRRRRNSVRWALAAGVVLAAGIWLWRVPTDVGTPALEPRATVVYVHGTATLGDGRSTPTVLQVGHEWGVGDTIETPAGAGVAWRGPHGEHVRLDQQSRIEWVSADHVRLLSGRVYVDTTGHANALGVLAADARVRHLGTRYVVTHVGSAVEVAVRSGQVTLVHRDDEWRAGRGEALVADASGSVSRKPAEPYGERWLWVDALAPAFDLDGQSVQAFMEWVAHETGRVLHYENDRARAVAERAELRGQVSGAPAEAMRVALAASDLQARVEGGVITVSLRSSG